MRYDYLIVGAGLFGATFAALAAARGKKCLVVEKRPFVGGNLYCENVEGITVHKYGAHIFHTDTKNVWDFVNKYCDMIPYVNSPLANYNGKIYNLPFNMNTFSKLWPDVKVSAQLGEKISLECMKYRKKFGEPKNLEEQALILVGKKIYKTFIKEYTEKQWGRSCKDLSPEIISRIPLRFIYDNNYFNDIYQGIPKGGYNVLIDNLFNHENIKIIVNSDYLKNRDYYNDQANEIIYTGPIDAFFNYKFGKLEWRTLRFKSEVLNIGDYQSNAVVNYTSKNVPYTRIIEHKYFDRFYEKDYKNLKTVITKEYPKEFEEGDEPYYPILDEKNKCLYSKYNDVAGKLFPNIQFCGRLGSYKYLDMDDTILEAMRVFNNSELGVQM